MNHFEREGLTFVLKLQRMPGEERAAFTHVRDPDRIPLEFLSFDKAD